MKETIIVYKSILLFFETCITTTTILIGNQYNNILEVTRYEQANQKGTDEWLFDCQ